MYENDDNRDFDDPARPGTGYYASAIFKPLAAAYSAMDIFDVAKPLFWRDRDGVLFPGGELMILSSVLQVWHTALETSETSYLAAHYSATPPSARADNAAWTLAVLDRDYLLWDPMPLGTPVAYTSTLQVAVPHQDTTITVGKTGTTSMELITVAGFTVGATERIRRVSFKAVVV